MHFADPAQPRVVVAAVVEFTGQRSEAALSRLPLLETGVERCCKGVVRMAKVNIRPLNDKILVKQVEAEDKTKGGIVLPDSAKEKPKEGVVVSVGSGKVLENGQRAPLQVKEKDRVIFRSYGSESLKVEGEEYLIMSEDDVLAVIA
jgi:chaperonin GroES